MGDVARSAQNWNMMLIPTILYYPFMCCNPGVKNSGQWSVNKGDGSSDVLDFFIGMKLEKAACNRKWPVHMV